MIPELGHYSLEEVFDMENWIDHTPPPSIGRVGSREKHFFKSMVQKTPEFKPKFRVVLANPQLQIRELE